MKLGQGYIFTGVCHSVNRGGVLSQHALQQVSRGVLSQHALQVVSQHALQQGSGGGLLSGVCSGGAFCCGLLLCPSVMAFWFGGLLLWPSGPLQRPYQKATKPEGYNRRGVPGGDLPSSPRTGTAAGGTHPTGMHSCITIVSFLVHMSLLIPSDVYFALRRMYIAASCSW